MVLEEGLPHFFTPELLCHPQKVGLWLLFFLTPSPGPLLLCSWLWRRLLPRVPQSESARGPTRSASSPLVCFQGSSMWQHVPERCSFPECIIFHCVNSPHLPYPFLY